MKKVTIFKSAVIALIACVGFVACSTESIETPTEPETQPETYTVKLGWAGEILELGEEPLASRASTNDLYGIQVYSKTEDAYSWVPYAYGLFDDPENISITLLANVKYQIVATMVKDGKSQVYYSYSGNYSFPFYHKTDGSTPVSNEFCYQVDGDYLYLGNGHTQLQSPNEYFDLPNTDRYYGELSEYVPNAENTKAIIQMKRTAFGAKFIAEGELANSGTLEVQIQGAPKIALALTEGEDVLFDIFTFNNVKAAWAEQGDYVGIYNVAINWISPEGTTMPLGTHEISFKRNATTVVTVNIEQQSETAGLGFGFDPSEQGNPSEDGENDITIGSGDTTDTDVEIN